MFKLQRDSLRYMKPKLMEIQGGIGKSTTLSDISILPLSLIINRTRERNRGKLATLGKYLGKYFLDTPPKALPMKKQIDKLDLIKT